MMDMMITRAYCLHAVHGLKGVLLLSREPFCYMFHVRLQVIRGNSIETLEAKEPIH